MNTFQILIPGSPIRIGAFTNQVDTGSPISPQTIAAGDQPLRRDVKLLGHILGTIIKVENVDVFTAVEKLRNLSRKWRSSNNSKLGMACTSNQNDFENMIKEAQSYDAETLLGVSRAFTHFLALANAAENHHRIRKTRERLLKTDYGLSPKYNSCGGCIPDLLHDGHTKDEVYEALCSQTSEIVLTAHPTEVNRRTMLRKHQAIQSILEQFDRQDLTNYERCNLEVDLRREVASIWYSDELRLKKPTPVDEARTGLAVVENVIWHAIPAYLRKLDDVCRKELGKALPLEIAPIKLASWMGGDRDGNPNVTPAITLEVSLKSRWTAATLFKADISRLRDELSLTIASPELLAITSNKEPYRDVLKKLESRLDVTLDWLNSAILGQPRKTRDAPVMTTAELRDPLLMLHRSLVEMKQEDIANGSLVDTIRRLSCLGVTLLPLDIRQESTRHTEALDAITKVIGVGSYASWDEETRRTWLQAELQSKRPLLPRCRDLTSYGFSPTVVDTLKTFEVAASLGPESLGAYVISQCQQASDVLAVTLLQQDAGVAPLLRVAPLFETLDDLLRAPATVEALFSMPVYHSLIKGSQEIMVGYSDSAKDAGRIAATWALYIAQESMVTIAKKYNIDLTFFHGKGGTVGRGGNPAIFQAIISHPPNTINGRFRVTEQGEMITFNLGRQAIAERTFDLFTAGVLVDRFQVCVEPKQEWRNMMEKLSETSCQVYRSLVREEPRFVPYFRSATPELELSWLNVGSRPAKRNPQGGVESLRAIPWVFAWTQTRLNLPTWLGVGEAITEAAKSDLPMLQEMYKDWPWFQTIVDLLEMILVKSELQIAENYDKQLVTDPASIELGKEIRSRFQTTVDAVLAISGNSGLQANNPILLRSLQVRNPYVDVLNVIQAELLRRLRADGGSLSDKSLAANSKREMLMNSLLITINGIANGMRNSG